MDRTWTRLRAAATSVVLAAALLVAASSAGAITWSLPAQVVSGAGQDADTPRVAALRDGGALAVYRTRAGAGDFYGTAARRINADGSFGPQRILTPGPSATSSQPRIAATPDGGAVAAWTTGDTDIRVEAVRLSSDGAPGATIQLVGGTPSAFGTAVVVAADGTATVAWVHGLDADAAVYARRISPAGIPGELITVSPPAAGIAAPQLAVAPDGSVTVAWHVGYPGAGVFARRINPDGTLGSILTIPHDPAKIPVDVGVATAPGGATHLAWMEDASVGRVAHLAIGPRPARSDRWWS